LFTTQSANWQRRTGCDCPGLLRRVQNFIAIATPEGGTFYVNEAGRRLVGLDGIDAVQQTSLIDYFYPKSSPCQRTCSAYPDGVWSLGG